ncbi:hypothetical protein CU097_010812 [Rhizopus azygosporus]|uniref:Uncharacterized protein n=1 Tax=Rhizopus azygosporus TaxID=86630 RepID=A0A367K1G8_RHIAZ|nr:hypothetical protein CU097_010812 [Rhizopus azygosporus]
MDCIPKDQAIQWIHSLLGSCVYGYAELSSQLFGYTSLFCWLCAQLPQMVENYQLQSADGLSLYLLYFWLAGDVANTVSCILNRQLPFQIYLAFYFCMTDLVLLFQYFYYRKSSFIESKAQELFATESREIVETTPILSTSPTYGSVKNSKRQLLALFLVFGFKSQSNLVVDSVVLGRLLAWACTIFYLSSRIPQIIKNHKRHSVEGLSLALFSFAVVGNITYALSIILHPGHTRETFINALPFIISAAGTLLFDMIIYIQFLWYNRQKDKILENRAIVEPEITIENTIDLIDKYYVAVPTPIESWKDDDLQLLKSPIGQRFAADLFTTTDLQDKPDFKLLTSKQRIFKSLFQYFDPIIAEGLVDVTKEPAYKETWAIYSKLENSLYPWIKPFWKNAFEINMTIKQDKGIVMCVGEDQFKHAASAVRALREVLKSDLPIEIFYINQYDLSKGKRDYFEAFKNVKTVDISTIINDEYTQFGGWAIKPYAMLASSFRHVILMDADVFMFQKPDTLFEDEGYKRTGALFFLDRTLFNDYEDGRRWLKSFLPTYSTYVEQSRWWKKTSAHEQESGIVVMDKKKVLFGLLSTCKMNDKQERDKVSYKHSHGDKETFWTGFEMVQTPYLFPRSYGAVLGGLGDAGAEGTVCGNQLHLDTNKRPWWWNGGLLRDKNRWENRYLIFTHYAEGEDWQFETSCIKEKDRIYELNEREKEIGEKLIELDKERKKADDI